MFSLKSLKFSLCAYLSSFVLYPETSASWSLIEGKINAVPSTCGVQQSSPGFFFLHCSLGMCSEHWAWTMVDLTFSFLSQFWLLYMRLLWIFVYRYMKDRWFLLFLFVKYVGMERLSHMAGEYVDIQNLAKPWFIYFLVVSHGNVNIVPVFPFWPEVFVFNDCRICKNLSKFLIWYWLFVFYISLRLFFKFLLIYWNFQLKIIWLFSWSSVCVFDFYFNIFP